MRRRGSAVRTFCIFALGAAAVSIVALLFAPASGKVTRRRIGLKIRAMRRQASQQIVTTKRLLARKASTLRRAATRRLQYARTWVTNHVTNGHSRRPARRVVHQS